MQPLPWMRATTLAAAALLAGCAAGPVVAPPAAPAVPAPRSASVELKILAVNDFHGNLKPPTGGFRQPDPAHPGKTISLPAGGAEYLASAVKSAAGGAPHHVFVAAGDLVGASPLLSALFHDEPTIESLGLMGLELAAVGNHEFDEGAAELLRLQRGGCHPVDGCRGPASFAGARFQYLAANTVERASGRTLLPPYAIKRYDGVPVAFIGLTLKDTPQIVVPSGVAGLEFRGEAETVNALVPELRRQGVEAIVLLIHEGGQPTGGYDECPGISGPIVEIVQQLDPAVDLVISGHTHQAYNCRIAGRLVTSAHRYGTLLTEIDVTLDRASGDVMAARARNLVVRHDGYAKDAAQTRLIAGYEALAAPLAKRVVGQLPQAYTAATNDAGESTLGRLVADAQLAATAAPERGGAQIAFTNRGGLRAPLVPRARGQVLYEDVFACQPFSNDLVTMTLTGAQVLAVLEQQFNDPDEPDVLPVSRGLRYTWDASRPRGHRVLPGSLKLNGRRIAPGDRLRVTVNSFLASGGDAVHTFARGGERVVGELDADALARYITAGAAPVDDERVTRIR
ncbi:bifunctional metallophosphatase/5'-nucleotidase [Ideonella sp.]|uniref:bifunctional metallophosphatase/5'-nucleotidase n=1 Tax=Ideonella sp. TaxID=1929293 RepID=UPI002B46A908|nr:bifunctional metallophosphatase/5'-nucleotidase [Ideonella sp.]HJV70825.1 bifunctional metallophosphatase/5'-nucleotidase [Ideonella sp.]